MSVSFKLRTTRTDGDGYLTARIQAEKLGVNLLIKTPIKVDIAKYTASPKGKVFPAYMSSPEGRKSSVPSWRLNLPSIRLLIPERSSLPTRRRR